MTQPVKFSRTGEISQSEIKKLSLRERQIYIAGMKHGYFLGDGQLFKTKTRVLEAGDIIKEVS